MKNSAIVFSLISIMVSVFIGISGVSQAEPYMAIRGGYKCGQCHINRTGGGMRTGFGAIYSRTVLPITFLNLSGREAFFDGKSDDRIAFGANLRVSNKTVFGVDRPAGTSRYDNSINLPEGNIYARFDLIDNLLSLYIDETVLPAGARNREAFVLIQNLPLNSYIKAGRMLLPFGTRILDDDSFIRQKTGYNYDNQDIGMEVGLEPGPYSLSVAVSNGTQGASENNIDKQISIIGSTVFRKARVGGSFSRNKTPGEPSSQITTMVGGFAGLYSGRFTLLGEADLIQARKEKEEPKDTQAREDYGDQLALYASLNTLIMRGVNFRIVYDYFDPRIKWDEDERVRLTLGLETFPFQFMQVGAFYRLLASIPQKPYENEDQLIVELHLFF